MRSGEAPVIRAVTPADHEQVRRLAPELLAGMPSWRSREGQELAAVAWVDAALTAVDAGDDQTVLVAVQPSRGRGGDRVLGFVGVTERRHFTGQRDGYVGELAVAHAARGRGVARYLMEAAEAWVRARGLTHVTLETGWDNHAARALYRHLGYVEEQVTLTKGVGGGIP